MVRDNVTTQKGQSILEYIITLAVIVAAIIAGTIGMNSRVRKGLDDSLNATHENLTQDLEAIPTGETKDLGNIYASQTPDPYTGNQTNGSYYFHEGESNMSYVPPVGCITETRDSSWQGTP